MSTLLADPVRVSDHVSVARSSTGRVSGSSAAARSRVSGGAAPTRKRVNRTGPRVGPRGLSSGPARAGVDAPSVRNPLPLRAALAIGDTEVMVPRTRIVAAPVGYRLTDRGIAVVAALVLVLICVASVTAAARFFSVTAEGGASVGSGVSISAPLVPGSSVPDAPRF